MGDQGSSRDHAPTSTDALEGAKVRIRSAGWWEDEDGERYFRFVLALDGKCPRWTLGQIMSDTFVLALSSAEQVVGDSSRDESQ